MQSLLEKGVKKEEERGKGRTCRLVSFRCRSWPLALIAHGPSQGTDGCCRSGGNAGAAASSARRGGAQDGEVRRGRCCCYCRRRRRSRRRGRVVRTRRAGRAARRAASWRDVAPPGALAAFQRLRLRRRPYALSRRLDTAVTFRRRSAPSGRPALPRDLEPGTLRRRRAHWPRYLANNHRVDRSVGRLFDLCRLARREYWHRGLVATSSSSSARRHLMGRRGI